ncbi:MAG: DUF484 family protein [Betaproteobacteria bacterium AqS2]|uniref:DUF484 family protein n=1 Tax=Candidatus Amphirhobacter heronislandensis TaxID=1732024 RepID=A0A930UFL2_9GAMM|nr:DUF484 family protein [Betaproteobacteria bacterium AqS2]
MREKLILQFLRDNPRFLRRHQSELTRMLRLAERDVVDLTGRQLVILREENNNLRKQLQEWYQAAADNEALIEFLHRYALELLAAPTKKGEAAKRLSRLIGRELEIKLCKIVDLKRDKVKLLPQDLRRFGAGGGVVRTDRPLKSFAGLVKADAWAAFLNIPVYRKRSLRAVVVCGSKRAKDFPRQAESDYALRLAELVGAALEREQ